MLFPSARAFQHDTDQGRTSYKKASNSTLPETLGALQNPKMRCSMFHHDYDMLIKLLPTTPGNPFISLYFNVADPELSCTTRLDQDSPAPLVCREISRLKRKKTNSCPSTKTAEELSEEGRMGVVVLSNRRSRCSLAA